MIDLNNNLSVCSDCINTDICIIYKTYGNIIDISRCKKKIEKNNQDEEITETYIDNSSFLKIDNCMREGNGSIDGNNLNLSNGSKCYLDGKYF